MNFRRKSNLARTLLPVALLASGVLSAGPNVEPTRGPLPEAALTALEKQRASVQRQMARITENAGRSAARRAAQSAWEKQRASVERQQRVLAERREPIDRQRASVERQIEAARPEGTLFTAARQPVTVAPWDLPASADCQRIPPAEINAYVEEVARRESLSAELLNLVIAHESSFRPCAVSHKGAMGMMQLMPQTAADLGVANPFDPVENIDGGARYLGYLKQRFGGDLRLALAAYNAGPRRVDDHRGVPPIPETVSYVSSILRHLGLSGPKEPSPKLGKL